MFHSFDWILKLHVNTQIPWQHIGHLYIWKYINGQFDVYRTVNIMHSNNGNCSHRNSGTIIIPGSGIVLEAFNLESRLLWASKAAGCCWIRSSSMKWRISLRTKKPFSWGARKKVCTNFLLPLKSLIWTEPETTTRTPPFQDSRECAVLISMPV